MNSLGDEGRARLGMQSKSVSLSSGPVPVAVLFAALRHAHAHTHTYTEAIWFANPYPRRSSTFYLIRTMQVDNLMAGGEPDLLSRCEK